MICWLLFNHLKKILHADIWNAHEHKNRWVIEMREKEGFIPQELSECPDVVLDGYCNGIIIRTTQKQERKSPMTSTSGMNRQNNLKNLRAL